MAFTPFFATLLLACLSPPPRPAFSPRLLNGPAFRCIGHDEERGDELRAIEFERIAGGKEFDVALPWFQDILKQIGQPAP